MDSGTFQRWEDGCKQYAPWHYQAEHMRVDDKDEYQLPTSEMKEVLHHLPRGWTDAPPISDRSRHKAVANGWHVGIATIIITILLACGKPAEAAHPRAQPEWLGHTTVDKMASLWSSTPLLTDTADSPPPTTELAALTDKRKHWEIAWDTPHPDHTQGTLEPGLRQTLQLW